jgi:hypothetical protein
MDFTLIAAGSLLLLVGRKLFWLFVAAAGYLISTTFVPQILPHQPESVILTISIIAGLTGALLAVMVQKFAVGLTGFAAGGYVVYYLLKNIVLYNGQAQWLAILAGALIGAVLAGSMIDWALILVTTTSGVMLVSQGLALPMPISAIVMLCLYILGIFVQGNMAAKD